MNKNIFYLRTIALIVVSVYSYATIVDLKSMDDYKNRITQSNSPAVIIFSATWCSFCTIIKPHIQELSEEPSLSNITFAHVDIDVLPTLGKEYASQGVPVLVYFDKGVKKDQLLGANSKENIRKFITKQLSTAPTITPPTTSTAIKEQQKKEWGDAFVDGLNKIGRAIKKAWNKVVQFFTKERQKN